MAVTVKFQPFSNLPVLLTFFGLISHPREEAGTVYMDFPVLTFYKDMTAAKNGLGPSLQLDDNCTMNKMYLLKMLQDGCGIWIMPGLSSLLHLRHLISL